MNKAVYYKSMANAQNYEYQLGLAENEFDGDLLTLYKEDKEAACEGYKDIFLPGTHYDVESEVKDRLRNYVHRLVNGAYGNDYSWDEYQDCLSNEDSQVEYHDLKMMNYYLSDFLDYPNKLPITDWNKYQQITSEKMEKIFADELDETLDNILNEEYEKMPSVEEINEALFLEECEKYNMFYEELEEE